MLFHALPRFELMGLDVPDAFAVSSSDFELHTREKGSQFFARASAEAELEGVQSFRAMGFAENDAKCVADAAVLHHCDLIVVGTEGRNALVRLLTGSIVPGLITAASVPVMVCKDSVPIVKRRHGANVRFRSQKKSTSARPRVPELTQHGAV
jgi:nucleotide-binding universal stress UspA family protein